MQVREISKKKVLLRKVIVHSGILVDLISALALSPVSNQNLATKIW